MRKLTKEEAIKSKERGKQSKHKYYMDNIEHSKKTRREYYRRTRDKRLISAKKYRETNKDKVAAYIAKWQKNNAARANALSKKHRMAKVNAFPKWANEFYICEIYDLAQRRTKSFGYKWHVDHIVPLQSKLVCGLHVEHNLQVIPASLNCGKQNRYWPDMPI